MSGLLNAAQSGDLSEVEKIFSQNPEIDVNETDTEKRTALHWACRYGHDKIASVLLAHPNIDVNHSSIWGETPLSTACSMSRGSHGRLSCAKLLLSDPRVDVIKPRDKHTPLALAGGKGRVDIVKWWIASGREMYFGEPGNMYNDVMAITKETLTYYYEPEQKRKERSETFSLLKKFKEDEERTRREVRLELGLVDQDVEVIPR